MTTQPGPTRSPRAGPDLLDAVTRALGSGGIRHIEHIPARAGEHTDWPEWASDGVRAAFARRGVERPWAHQATVAENAYRGRNVVISTGTASGKSLGYQLPITAALASDAKACALYLAPTKALAADQLASWESLQLSDIRPATYDGDTPPSDRQWARRYGNVILTNPDMLHRGILPGHERWARLLRHLRYVVVDECHYYRGVFGSHVALILRRLRRLAAHYGATPTFVLASATVADPAAAATRLIGAPVTAVTADTAPYAGAQFVLWGPGAPPAASHVPPSGTPHAAAPATDVRGSKARISTGFAPKLRLRPATMGNTGGEGAAEYHSASTEAARITAALVGAGVRTLTFVRSRAGAEYAADLTKRVVAQIDPALAAKVSSYRAGYLPEDRRALERAFDSGELMSVTSTNALELGVDIAGIDAAVLAGYPGSLASMWQQAGRAGRSDNPALVIFVARDDPLDSFLVRHPVAVFGQAVEAAVIDPTNPHVLSPQLACAAAELPLADDAGERFGDNVDRFGSEPKLRDGVAVPPDGDTDPFHSAAARLLIDQLVRQKVLRRRPHGVFFAGHHHPARDIDLRGSGEQIALVEADTGRLLGTEDSGRVTARAYPGAVYLHRGQQFVVQDLDIDGGIALLERGARDWWTSPHSTSTIDILEVHHTRTLPGGLTVNVGEVRVTEQVVGYTRRLHDGTLLDTVDLDMPEQVLNTTAVWYTIPERVLIAPPGTEKRHSTRDSGGGGVMAARIPGALHAAEHAAIGLLPLFAGCDRSDIGGLSTALHADTDAPTVFVYDGVPGGAGFAERGFAVAGDWLGAVRDAVASCPCSSGCPSCVQSPKCGNGNEPLDKAGAVAVLGLLMTALAGPTDQSTARPRATGNAP